MKIFKFTLNAGFSKQSFLNYYSTEVKANHHIPYIYIYTNFQILNTLKEF